VLAIIDIVEFEDRGQNEAMQPIVPYDRIERHIDDPLVDDDAGTETTVNADTQCESTSASSGACHMSIKR